MKDYERESHTVYRKSDIPMDIRCDGSKQFIVFKNISCHTRHAANNKNKCFQQTDRGPLSVTLHRIIIQRKPEWRMYLNQQFLITPRDNSRGGFYVDVTKKSRFFNVTT